MTAWSDNDYKPVPPDSGVLSNVWLLSGDDLIRAGLVVGRAPNLRVERVAVYDRAGGVLQRVLRASSATPGPGRAWNLADVTIYDANMNMVRRVPRLTGMEGITPSQLTLAKVDPNQLDYSS